MIATRIAADRNRRERRTGDIRRRQRGRPASPGHHLRGGRGRRPAGDQPGPLRRGRRARGHQGQRQEKRLSANRTARDGGTWRSFCTFRGRRTLHRGHQRGGGPGAPARGRQGPHRLRSPPVRADPSLYHLVIDSTAIPLEMVFERLLVAARAHQAAPEGATARSLRLDGLCVAAAGGGRCNRRMDEILRHVVAVLPQFTLACLVLAALPDRRRRRPAPDGARRAGAGLAAVAGNGAASNASSAPR